MCRACELSLRRVAVSGAIFRPPRRRRLFPSSLLLHIPRTLHRLASYLHNRDLRMSRGETGYLAAGDRRGTSGWQPDGKH
uniref:Uncharacterized protein n=1 Tax=Oryza punctata TaxID=4537 RepID=A0A0E0LQS9_ORYPU